MQSINALALHEKIMQQENFVLIDVREPFEHELFNIGGILLPMNQVLEHATTIPKDRPVILYCQKGIRSALVIQRLEQRFHFRNLINLSGGIDAWQKQIPNPKDSADAATSSNISPS